MGEVDEITQAFTFSISKLAQAFGMDRATVRKRIDQMGVEPSAKKKGHPVYHIADVCVLKTDAAAPVWEDEDFDPDRLPPKERKDWYEGSKVKDSWYTDRRKLIPEEEFYLAMSEAMKQVNDSLVNLSDILERDCALEPEALDRVDEVVNSVRAELKAKLQSV